MANFIPAFEHAFGDHILAVLTAGFQTAAQFLDRGRKDEDRQGVFAKVRIADLNLTLPVDVKQNVPTRVNRFAHRSGRRAVEIPKNVGVFQHLAIGDLLFERILGLEVILAPILLARAWGAGGGRDRKFQPLIPGHQTPRQSGFAGARRRRQDDKKAPTICHFNVFRHYSTFCTCSRIWSITAFSSNPTEVRSVLCALEHKVFASRLNSCIRKSSLRPTAPS